MKPIKAALLVVVAALATFTAPSLAQSAWVTKAVQPKYVSPAELAASLGAVEANGRTVVRWGAEDALHEVTLRRNDGANRLVLDGPSADVELLEAQIEMFDVAPRQIALEARIVEVDTDAASDLGVDWSAIRSNASVDWRGDFYDSERNSSINSGGLSSGYTSRADEQTGATASRLSASLTNALTLLEEKGAATFRDAPRLLTLNNRPATVLDGHRVTYVNRANGYANVYQTETMDAGLRLEVTPSLVESGYLRLDIEAELSSLVPLGTGSSRDYVAISGSPVKQGQIIRNTVMAKDGETIVLAGFTRTVNSKTVRRFPVLGVILPFLFSREIIADRHHESVIVITPRVVDLAGNVTPHDREILEGR